MELTSNTQIDSVILENRFNYIVNKINLLKNDNLYKDMLNLNPSIKLGLYKYYKQATIGDCDIEEPTIDDTDVYSKWSAWNEAKNVTKKDSMISYINIYESHLAKINEIRINQIELLLNTSNMIV